MEAKHHCHNTESHARLCAVMMMMMVMPAIHTCVKASKWWLYVYTHKDSFALCDQILWYHAQGSFMVTFHNGDTQDKIREGSLVEIWSWKVLKPIFLQNDHMISHTVESHSMNRPKHISIHCAYMQYVVPIFLPTGSYRAVFAAVTLPFFLHIINYILYHMYKFKHKWSDYSHTYRNTHMINQRLYVQLIQ